MPALPPRLPGLLLRAFPLVAAVAAGYALRSFSVGQGPMSEHATALGVVGTAVDRGAVATRATDFGPAVELTTPSRVPGEFEHTAALLLGVNELLEYHRETLVEIVSAIDGQTPIIALIARPEQERQALELLRGRGLATDAIQFFLWPAESMWVQDFGPQVIVAGGRPRVIDVEYLVPGRETENQLPMAFAATFGIQIAHSHLAMEGGSYLSNGRGLCISSTRLIDQNESRGHDMQSIARILKSHFGFGTWSYLPPIVGESTGHLDLFLSIGGPSTVFLASYDRDDDRDNAERMDANAATLAESVLVDGRPLEIIRVPQPAARDGCWRSYTNVVYANGVLLVPQYPDHSPDLDRQALAIYRRACPDRRVVGIDSARISTKRGGLHCLTRSIPMMPAAGNGRVVGAERGEGDRGGSL